MLERDGSVIELGVPLYDENGWFIEHTTWLNRILALVGNIGVPELIIIAMIVGVPIAVGLIVLVLLFKKKR